MGRGQKFFYYKKGRKETQIKLKKYLTSFNEVIQTKEKKNGQRNKVPEFNRQ